MRYILILLELLIGQRSREFNLRRDFFSISYFPVALHYGDIQMNMNR